jgi:gliding motility-associated-like protein
MSGTYTLTITVPGLPCQYPPAQIAVNVRQIPFVYAGSDLVILQHNSEPLRAIASGDYLTFKWEPAIYLDNDTTLNPVVIHPKLNTKYKLTATSFFGCTAYSEVSVTVPFTVPNTFTPNGDGIGDTFEIEGINNYPNCVVSIYDRWGQLLYASIGYRNPWDGVSHGVALPAATYYYEVNLGNGSDVVGGYVALVR